MRIYIGVLAFSLTTCAPARADERARAWDDLIAEARARGAVETLLDRSASYVFQQPDGAYVTFTRLLKTDKGRSICLISQAETATACVDWETGKLTLGDRADAATPWRFRSRDSLEAFEAEQPGVFARLGDVIASMFAPGKGSGSRGARGHYQLSKNGNWYWVSNLK